MGGLKFHHLLTENGMTDTRSPDTVLKQLSRVRDALQQYGAAYGLALALVAFVVITTRLIGPEFTEPYLFFIPGVLIAGIVGGWGPGLLATFLSLAIHLYFTGEYSNLANTSSPTLAIDIARALTFMALGIGISCLASVWAQAGCRRRKARKTPQHGRRTCNPSSTPCRTR